MADRNEVFLTGTVDSYGDKSPVEVRFTKGGASVASFQLKTEEVFKSKTISCWHDIIAWNELGEACGEYQKGTRLSIKGRLSKRSWEDKDTGKKRYKVEVVANEIEVVGQVSQAEVPYGIVDDAEIPF